MKITESQLRRMIKRERRRLIETQDLGQLDRRSFLAELEAVYMNAESTGNFPSTLEDVASWMGANVEELFRTILEAPTALDEHPWLEDLMAEYES